MQMMRIAKDVEEELKEEDDDDERRSGKKGGMNVWAEMIRLGH